MGSDFAPGLRIERCSNKLVVQAENTTSWSISLLCVAIGLIAAVVFVPRYGLSITINDEVIAPGSPKYYSSYLFMVGAAGLFSLFFSGVGLLMMAPRTFITVFDSKSRTVVHSTSIWNRSPNVRRYSFDELSEAHLHADPESDQCLPYVKLKGRIGLVSLVPSGISVRAGYDLIDAICTVTGLPKNLNFDAATVP